MANLGLLNNNPGNLKDPATGNFQTFTDPNQGKQALINDLNFKKSGQSPHIKPGGSLLDLAKVWAPASDNNVPENWANNVAKALGVSTAYAWDKVPTDQLASAIQVAEGTTGLGTSSASPSSTSTGSVSSLAQKIKAKYPQYNDIPDDQLVQKILAKYPQYADLAGQAAPQKSVGTYNPKPYSSNPGQFDLTGNGSSATPAQGAGLGAHLMTRANAISKAVSDTTSGKINPASGVIQGLGAVAGGINDTVTAGLELIPGFKDLENLIGSGVGQLAKTPAGQAVGKAMQDFATAHPELASDIGAGVDIVTAIPILKGLGTLANVGKDAASVALKNIAEKGVANDLTEVASRTVGGRTILAKVPDAVKTLVSERAIPDVTKVGGRLVYSTDAAHGVVSDAISAIDTKELQPILEQVSQRQNFGQNLATLKKAAIKEVENDASLKEAGAVPQALKQVENRFAGWQYSYGDSVKLDAENRMKIGTGKFTDWKTPEGSADKAIYRAIQTDIEDTAAKNGFTEVNAINKKMSGLIKAQQVLKYIEGKTVKNPGLIHGLIQGAATAGGEMAGNAVGVPIAGAVVGNKTSGLIEKALSALSPRAMRAGILERTAPNAVRQTFRGTVKKVGGLIGASLANKASHQ